MASIRIESVDVRWIQYALDNESCNYGDTLLISSSQFQLLARWLARLATRLAPPQPASESLFDPRHGIVGAKSGRPLNSAARSAAKDDVSVSASNNSSTLPTCSSSGATRTSPSSRLARCARALDHAQSCGRATSRAHRIKRHIARGGGKVCIVHHHRAEPALKQMTGAAPARLDEAGIAAVGRAETRQARRRLGREHQVDMVGHQAIGPDLDRTVRHCSASRSR